MIGVGLRVISGKIEKSWDCNYNAIKAMSTLEITKGNNKFKNLIITAQNMRYAVHDESNGNLYTTVMMILKMIILVNGYLFVVMEVECLVAV